MSNSTGSGIPEEIAYWLRVKASGKWEEKGMYSANERNAYVEGAEEMYCHLQEEKPKGMQWVSVNERLPEDDQNLHFTLYGNRGRGMIHRVYFDKWNVTHWLDESSDDISALRSENERLKGERDEYRILLEELSESARASDMPSVANGIDVILDKYPKPTT